MRQKIFFISIVLITFFSFFSCQYLPLNKHEDNTLKKYDGSYSIVFICEDICMANAIVEITNGKIDGEIKNINQQTFLVIGYVESEGNLQLQSISENSDLIIEASGNINADKIVTGNYSVDERNCKLFGFRYSNHTNNIISQYDGNYELELTRAGQKIDTIMLNIQNGQFNTNLTTSTTDAYNIKGEISQQGNIIINTLFSNKDAGITVIGSIHKNGTISGDYYKNPGIKGKFTGRKISD
jgi:hypothetical protein